MIERVVPHIEAAISEAGRDPVPGFADYHLRATAEGRCLFGSVWRDDVPLVGVGVALHSRCGAVVWRELHRTDEPLETDPQRQPPTPWCAARLELSLVFAPEVVHWLGDYERCLAWAFLRMRTAQ